MIDPGSRSRRSLRVALLGLLCPALLGAPFVARAQDPQETKEGEGSLAPDDVRVEQEGDRVEGGRESGGILGGFAFFVEAAPHVVVQRARGSAGTNFNVTSRKSNIVTNMTFRLGGGIKGPTIDALWGKPRPVAWAAALVPINESSTIGTIFVETTDPVFEQIEFSKYSVEYQTSALWGVGMEFGVPVWDSEITITPAIESLHLVTRYVGDISLQRNATGASELHTVRGKEEATQHFLGPAVRMGTPTIVVRGVAIDFFLDVSLLLDVAGTRKQFVRTGDDGDAATFNFEAGKGLMQVGSGFQLRWP